MASQSTRIRALTLGSLAILGLVLATVSWLADGPEQPVDRAAPVTSADAPAPAGPTTDAGPIMPLLADELAPAPEPPPVVIDTDMLSFMTSQDPGPERARTLRLVIVDAASGPVPDARVEVWPSLGALSDPGRQPVAVHVSDSRGRCELDLGLRRGVVLAAKAGLGSSGLWSWAGLASRLQADGEAVVMLVPLATLRGRVVHADDGPALGVDVLCMPRPMNGTGEGRAPAGRITTDGDGRFEVVVDGTARLAVVAVDGELVSHEVRVDASPGAELDIELRFPGRWSIDGVLLDPDAEPAPDGSVTLWRHFPGYDVLGGERPADEPHRAATTTDEDGRFRFEVPRPGEYILVGQGDETPPSPAQIAFVDDAVPRVDVTLQLLPAAAIAGRLVSADGLPLPGVTIHARPAHLFEPAAFAYAPTVWGLFGEARADTDEDGRFELAPLHSDGSYIVFCRPDEQQRDNKLVVKDVRPGGRELLLVATEDALRRGWVGGVVLSDATGLPVDSFVPTLVIELDGRVVDTQQAPVSSDDGSFRLEGLAPGYRYALRIDAPGHGTVELPWFTASHRGHQVTARLPAVSSLEVTVLGDGRRPVELAEVTIERQAQIAGWRGQRTAHSDALGRAHFADLPPGSYAIEVRHGGRKAGATADVAVAQPSTLSVELPR